MINRPVPPGRPRGSQVRSTSQSQLQRSHDGSSAGSSPFASSSTLPNVIEAGAKETFASNGLGLQMDATGQDSSSTHEIPLEDVEDALRTLSRDDLVLALKRAKEQLDILDSKLEVTVERTETLESTLSEYATQLETLETEKAGLEFALSHREERIDDLMREQDRVENEVYLKAQVTERLRKQLEDSERARIDAEKRYEEQTTTSDKERQYYVDMEKLLQTQKAKASSALERAQSANHELVRQNERLQSQLLQVRRGDTALHVPSPSLAPSKKDAADDQRQIQTHFEGEEEGDTTVDSQFTPSSSLSPEQRSLGAETDQKELDSLRNELVTLQTSHSSLMATLQQLQAELRDVKTANVDLRTQNETFVDLLQEKTINGEFVTESAMLHRRYSTAELTSETSSDIGDETTTTETSEADDDDDDVPDVPKRKSKGKSVEQNRRNQLMQKASHSILNAPRNLASELEKSDPHENAPEGRRRDRIRERSGLGTNVDQLHKEIWDLRDANQALTLYVTKILDRIISREGYENVLAIDADQRRTLRGKPSTRFRADRPAASPSTSPEATHTSSGGRSFLGLGRNPPTADPKSPPTPTAADSTITAAQAKAARRNTSIDWRSFLPIVGSGGSNPSASSPLTPSLPMSSPEKSRGDARRIRSSEEVEDKDDEKVREQIRQSLLNQGLVLPENQLKPQKRTSTIGTFLSRVIGTSDASALKAVSESAPEGQQKEKETRSAGEVGNERGDIRTSPRSRNEMRQRALDSGGISSGNLTDAPARRSLIEEFRARRSENSSNDARSTSSRASGRSGVTSEFGDVSLSPSVSPSLGVALPTAEGNETETGWKKAMRRVSLLGSSPANPTLGPDSLKE